MSIRFLAGHDFGSRDNQPDAPRCVIVNKAFVRKFFGNENPLGRRLTQLANAPVWNEIAGIVKDAKYPNLRNAAPPMIYIPYGRIADWLPQQAHPGESMFLQHKHFAYPVESLIYPNAGHTAGRPQITPEWHGSTRHPVSGRPVDLGGTPEGNADSSIDAIPKVLEFLRKNLQDHS